MAFLIINHFEKIKFIRYLYGDLTFDITSYCIFEIGDMNWQYLAISARVE